MREIAHAQGASVERVFGKPIEAGDLTVIPVAAVGRLFDGRIAGEAPVGALEVSADGARFVSAWDRTALAAALLAGAGLGLLLGRLIR